MYRHLSVLAALILLAVPCAAEVTLFAPHSDQIPSDHVNDIAQDRGGTLWFATDNGLAGFNGSWSTMHIDYADHTHGLISDMVQAVEADAEGRLWIGYPNGIQIYDGTSFFTLQDQQLLKSLAVHDLQRCGDAMWVATDHAGVHRYQNGSWTWFRPHTPEGPGCYQVEEIAVDRKYGDLILVSRQEGIWRYSDETSPRFTEVLFGDAPLLLVQGGATDPLGGVYLYNATMVFHYQREGGAAHLLDAADLLGGPVGIQDVSAGRDGSLWIATDAGIYRTCEGRVTLSLGRSQEIFGGIVRILFVDAQERCWFAMPGYAGYYFDAANRTAPMGFQSPEGTKTGTHPSPQQTPRTPPVFTGDVNVADESARPQEFATTWMARLQELVDALLRALPFSST
jgi:hypothetical protein